MNKKQNLWMGCVAMAAVMVASGLAQTAENERWLHVRVEKTGDGAETVRVNVPLDVAVKVLPAIRADPLREGRIRIREARIKDVDVRAVLEAVREMQDGEFVTIESPEENVRVAKQNGYLLVKVDERKDDGEEKVDVKVPFVVVEALLSGEEDELNILAAVEALRAIGDEVLVTVESRDETVRVWVDSKSTME